jgi:F-type H+-transporting ATPase subunit delta
LSISALSRRYARALVEISAEQKLVEQYGDELAQVSTTVSENDMLRLLLESPTLPVEKKSAIMGDLAEKMQLSIGMRHFIGLLVAKNRMKYIGLIESNYRQFADELSGLLRAKVSSAAELSAPELALIRQGLEGKTGKRVELAVQVDPALLGGLKTEFAGKVYDGSIRTQLKRIEETLNKG